MSAFPRVVTFLAPLLIPFTVWEYIAHFHPDVEVVLDEAGAGEGFAPSGDCAGGEG